MAKTPRDGAGGDPINHQHKRTIKRYLAQRCTGVVRDIRGVATHEVWQCSVEYVDGSEELITERRRVDPRLDRYDTSPPPPHSVFASGSASRGKQRGREKRRGRGRGRGRTI